MNRRRFLTGLGAALCAPAIIRTPGLLMPVKPRMHDFKHVGLAVDITVDAPFGNDLTRTIYCNATIRDALRGIERQNRLLEDMAYRNQIKIIEMLPLNATT